MFIIMLKMLYQGEIMTPVAWEKELYCHHQLLVVQDMRLKNIRMQWLFAVVMEIQICLLL